MPPASLTLHPARRRNVNRIRLPGDDFQMTQDEEFFQLRAAV
jgi:hypothetical protein